MSPTSYQAAPPRVRGRHYRGEPRGCQRTRMPMRRRGAQGTGTGSARGGRGRVGLRLLEQEQDLAGTAQAQLLARDLLDAVGVVAEVGDVGRQAIVDLVQRPDLVVQSSQEAPLAVSLDEP